MTCGKSTGILASLGDVFTNLSEQEVSLGVWSSTWREIYLTRVCTMWLWCLQMGNRWLNKPDTLLCIRSCVVPKYRSQSLASGADEFVRGKSDMNVHLSSSMSQGEQESA